MKATVFIENLRVDTIIGICDWELEKEQPLFFDVSAEVDCHNVSSSDSIDHALDYAQLAVKLSAFVKENELKLLEPLLKALAQFLLQEFELIDTLDLSVRKPGAIEQANCAGIRARFERSVLAAQ